MKTIPVRELRNDYAAVLRQVEAGESFTVTKDGRPIASITPFQETGPRRLVPGGEAFGLLRGLGAQLAAELAAERAEWDGPDEGDPFDAYEQARATRASTA